MILFDAPHIIRDVKLLGHIAQVLVVAHYAGYVALKLTSLPACQQVVQAMAHLRYKNGHTRTAVAEIKAKLYLEALLIERLNILLDFLAWYQKRVQFPLYPHKKHAVLMVYILVEVNNVSLVVRNEFCYF